MDGTKIEWTDSTWNPVTGCTKVSPGCDHCYAETIAERFAGTKAYPKGFGVTLRPERLDQPLRWTRPRRVFVNSMSDLFHDDIPDEYIAKVFAVMALSPHHTFQVLTKRHGRLRSLLGTDRFAGELLADAIVELLPKVRDRKVRDAVVAAQSAGEPAYTWPLPNVWLGVSVENQQWADIRIPALVHTPAAVRFLSMEPLLGPVKLPSFCACGCGKPYDVAQSVARSNPGSLNADQAEAAVSRTLGIDWVIVGGESGREARPMHPEWARSLREQCGRAGVAFHFKQWGEWAPGSAAAAQHREAVIAEDGEWIEPSHELWSSKPHTAEENTRRWAFIHRPGKRAAGRDLDGRTWDEFPALAI